MTRLVEGPAAGRPETALPAAAPIGRRSPRRSQTHALTVVVLADCELVVHGLAQMLAPFRARVQIRRPEAHRDDLVGSPDLPGSRPADIVLFDCYAGGVTAGVVRALPAPPAPSGSKVVAYTWETREELLQAALEHGYRGVVGKSLSGRALVDALERIGQGERVVCAQPRPAESAPVDIEWFRDDTGLTPREVDVLDLIAAGHTNAEIAVSLHVSINSVKSYIRSGYRKIGATSRSQAVLWGIAQGLGASDPFQPAPGRVS